MIDFDLSTFAGIAMAVMMAVQGLKKMFPAFMVGKEEGVAMLLPLVLGVISKLSGSFAELDWSNFVILLLLSGMTSQIAHDKMLNPLADAMKKSDPPQA